MTISCQVKNLKWFDKNRKTIKSFSKTVKYTKAKEKMVRSFFKKISE